MLSRQLNKSEPTKPAASKNSEPNSQNKGLEAAGLLQKTLVITLQTANFGITSFLSLHMPFHFYFYTVVHSFIYSLISSFKITDIARYRVVCI